MSLGFVNDRFGEKTAKEIAERMEYKWNYNKYYLFSGNPRKNDKK